MSDLPSTGPETSGWVAVRCLFRTALDETNQYEERITLWRTASMQEAIRRAEAEAEEYAALLDSPQVEHVGLAQAYLLFDAVDDGAEVFSLMRDSDLAPADYIDAFFETGTERQAFSLDGEAGS